MRKAFAPFFAESSLVSSNTLNSLLIPTFRSTSETEICCVPSGRFFSILSVSTAILPRFVPADSANRAAASGSIANPLPEKYCAIHDGIS